MSQNHSTHIRFEFEYSDESNIVTSLNKIPYFGSENFQVSHPIFRGINYNNGSHLGKCTDLQVIVIEHDRPPTPNSDQIPTLAGRHGHPILQLSAYLEACFRNAGWGSLDSSSIQPPGIGDRGFAANARYQNPHPQLEVTIILSGGVSYPPAGPESDKLSNSSLELGR